MLDFISAPVQDWGSEARSEARVAFAEPKSAEAKLVDLATRAACVRLDLEDLPYFTAVNRQYEAWGVRFENAVAIHPSNPAYLPGSGMMVLLGAPRGGWLEAKFLRPVQHVGSFVISSRRTVMRAFNRQNQLVAEVEAEANLGQASRSLHLSSAARNIYRVTLECFNGQLTVDDFCFYG